MQLFMQYRVTATLRYPWFQLQVIFFILHSGVVSPRPSSLVSIFIVVFHLNWLTIKVWEDNLPWYLTHSLWEKWKIYAFAKNILSIYLLGAFFSSTKHFHSVVSGAAVHASLQDYQPIASFFFYIVLQCHSRSFPSPFSFRCPV